jgi:hypothetical protein
MQHLASLYYFPLPLGKVSIKVTSVFVPSFKESGELNVLSLQTNNSRFLEHVMLDFNTNSQRIPLQTVTLPQIVNTHKFLHIKLTDRQYEISYA